MKQYVIDELRLEDYKKIKIYFCKKFTTTAMPGIYWIQLEKEQLTKIQAEHTACQPFYIAIELEENRVSCEFLIRSTQRIRCNCIRFGDKFQRNWLMDMMDAILMKLKISI